MTEILELAGVAGLLYVLTKLDCRRRAAAMLGILCGAIAASGNPDLVITVRVVAVWALAGFLITAILFHREIRQRLR